MASKNDMAKKIALITGANKGIGREVAAQLGALGITVLIGARDPERGAQAATELAAAGVDARPVVLDVTNDSLIDAAAAQIEREYGRLDILVNNAGISLDHTIPNPSQTTPDTLRQTYETNVFGVFGVTRALLPLLHKADSGRIVNVSSGLGSLTLNSPDGMYAPMKALAYNSSKAAINMMTVVLAKELRDTPIKINAADPGYTATDLNGNSGPRTVAQAATEIVRLATLPQDGPTGGFFNEDGTVPW